MLGGVELDVNMQRIAHPFYISQRTTPRKSLPVISTPLHLLRKRDVVSAGYEECARSTIHPNGGALGPYSNNEFRKVVILFFRWVVRAITGNRKRGTGFAQPYNPLPCLKRSALQLRWWVCR